MITEAKLDTILANPKVADVSDIWAFQDLLVKQVAVTKYNYKTVTLL
jgi:hypothetical protein